MNSLKMQTTAAETKQKSSRYNTMMSKIMIYSRNVDQKMRVACHLNTERTDDVSLCSSWNIKCADYCF